MTNTEIIQAIRNEIERLKEDVPCRYHPYSCASVLEAYEELLSFLSTLESEKPINPDAAMKELDEKIALVKQRGTWDGIDVDKYMDEVRGREPEKPMQEGLEEEVISYFQGLWPGTDTPEECNTHMHFTPPAIMRLAIHFAQWGAEHLANSNDEVVINGHEFAYDKGKDALTMKPISDDLEEAADEMAISAFPEKKSYSTVYDRVVDYNAVDRKNYRDGIIAGWKAKEESENHVPKDLQEYASRAGFDYVDNIVQEHPGHRFNDHDVEYAYRDGIIEGAKWDREQMLKDAVKWLVDDDYDELTDKGRFILGSVGIGYNGYYIPYSDLLKLPKEDEQ